jgi:hypothetical protein
VGARWQARVSAEGRCGWGSWRRGWGVDGVVDGGQELVVLD